MYIQSDTYITDIHTNGQTYIQIYTNIFTYITEIHMYIRTYMHTDIYNKYITEIYTNMDLHTSGRT